MGRFRNAALNFLYIAIFAFSIIGASLYFKENRALILGIITLVFAIIAGVQVYFKKPPEVGRDVKSMFIACILIAMMSTTTGTMETISTGEVSAFIPPDMFNATLQMSTNASGFGDYSTMSIPEFTQGDIFTIQISVNDANDLYCWRFSVQWDEPVLNLYGITEGPLLLGYDTIFTYAELEPGHIVALTCCRKGDVSGASGSGIIAWISFYANSPGNASISLYDGGWVKGTTLTRHNYPPVNPMQVIVNPLPSTGGSSSGGSRKYIC